MMDATLVLVHKKPELGTGKQRLAARFGLELTLQIAQALFECAVEDAADWPGLVVLAPANQKDSYWARLQARRCCRNFMIVPQISGNLGQRLNALDLTLRRQKLKRLVYIGSDAPGLKNEDYLAVRAYLNQSNAVLVPAVDGGVVLMANRCAWPDLSMLPWSTDQLGVSLVNKCKAEMGSVSILQENYDIDESADFFRLIHTLKDDGRPARRALHTLACEASLAMNNSDYTRHA
ncbi:MAG: DUF2064 domain-containing protein [Burkholderiales bacterium]|nr:DUF2064 domain-containing protein [Burkholderiales bacterium]